MSSHRPCLALLLIFGVGGGGCGSSTPPAPSAPPPAARAASAASAASSGARAVVPESAFERVDADAERKTATGATLSVPRGWFFKPGPERYTFEEPDREFAIVLLEVESKDANAAIAKAWERLGRKAPTKIEKTESEKDVNGWDELVETEYGTPAAEGRLVFMNARRKDNRAWVFLVDAKKDSLGKRGAQLAQILGGLKVPGVEEEDLSKNAALTLEGERAKAFDTFVESVRVKTQVPGAAVAVVQDGRIVFEKGFGTRTYGKSDPVTPRTRFMIGSVTKSLSSLLVAKLVDEGKLKWDTPIKALLPSFETGDPEFTAKLALWHTFCACTGMPRRDLPLVFEYGKVKAEAAFTFFSGLKPTTGFGETFQYSNQMTALGGFLAARVAEPNKPLTIAYETAMKTRLFGPMGMNDTTASFDEGRKGPAATPHGSSLLGAYGEPISLPPAMESFVVPSAPAGAIFSTAHDMARYALVELANGKTPEGKEVVSSVNLLERRKPRTKVGAKSSYGLGLGIARSSGVEIVTHDGGTFGFVSRFMLVPSKKIGLVILTNDSNGDSFARPVTRRLFEVVLGGKERALSELADELGQGKAEFEKLRAKAAQQEMPDALRTQLVGTWQSGPLGAMVLAPDPKQPKILRADVGEWSSRLGYRKDEDGPEELFFLDPPVASLALRLDGKDLVTELGQDKARFTKRP